MRFLPSMEFVGLAKLGFVTSPVGIISPWIIGRHAFLLLFVVNHGRLLSMLYTRVCILTQKVQITYGGFCQAWNSWAWLN